jgi:galactokinase
VTDPREAVESTFVERFASAPHWRFRVPGRLEVFGKHTDYAGGRALVAAVPRGFAVAAQRANDGRVDVTDALSRSRFLCRAGDPQPHVTAGWHRYGATVVRRLTRNFPSADLSARVVLASNLPSAAGISSSSALIVGIAEALIAAGRLEETREWQDTIRTVEDRVSYLGCIENGASFGALSGAEGVGTHGGSEDHAAILLSEEGALQQFSFAPLRLERRVAIPDDWTFVILSSGVRADKTGMVREAYNSLAAEAAAITELWRRQSPADTRSLGELARVDALSSLSLSPRLSARLAHLRAEDARVAEASLAFAKGDVQRIGELAADSQRDAEALLGNQVPETIELVSMARERGAAAASAFGAGWGGSVWALVRSADAEVFLEEWIASYQSKYPRREPTGFVSPPSNGLHRLT